MVGAARGHLTFIFNSLTVAGPQAPSLHRRAAGRHAGRCPGCLTAACVPSPLGFARRAAPQPPGAREGRVGAAFWHFAELDGSTQRQDTSAGPEICRVSGANHQRPSQTGWGPTEHPPPLRSTSWSPDLVSFCLLGPQVQLYSSLHLTRAVLSWLLDDGGQLMTELWKTVSWFRDADHFSVSAQISRLLFPHGASGPQTQGFY